MPKPRVVRRVPPKREYRGLGTQDTGANGHGHLKYTAVAGDWGVERYRRTLRVSGDTVARHA